MKIYLNEKKSNFLKQTLCWIGIYLQDNKNTVVYKLTDQPSIPYTIVYDGMMVDIKIIDEFLKKNDNIILRKNGEVVFEKISNTSPILEIINVDGLYDMYNTNEREALFKLIEPYDRNPSNVVYIKNTEEYPAITKNESSTHIAGVASGTHLCKLAKDLGIKEITFFDYSQSSLDMQKDLVEATNRKEVFRKYLKEKNLISGIEPATLQEIDALDEQFLDDVYDYAKSCSINYLNLDLRNTKDLFTLFDSLPNNSYVWLSNVYYYAGSGSVSTDIMFYLIDRYVNEKGFILFPHTRIIYEG